MPKVTRKLPSFEGVAAGQTATLRCTIGLTYHQILVTYSGATLAQLNGLRVVANGQIIWRITEVSKLDIMNQFEGRAAAAGVFVIDFDRHNLRTIDGEELSALGTGHPEDRRPITTLSIEIDIDAAASSPVLRAKAIQSAARPVGLVKQIREFNYNAAAAGVFEISDLPKGHIFNQIYFGGDTARDFQSLTMERDNFIGFERSKAENEMIQGNGKRTVQDDYFVYDPTESGAGTEGLATLGVNDLRFKLNVTNSGAVPVTVVSLAPLDI